MTDLREHRHLPRLRLDPPLDVLVGRVPGLLVDLSLDGGRVVLPPARVSAGDSVSVEMGADTDRVSLLSRVAWIERSSAFVVAGLAFIGVEDLVRLRICSILLRATFQRLHANGVDVGALAWLAAQRDEANGSVPYLQLSLRNGEWLRAQTFLPRQPSDGLMVRSSASPDAIEELCDVYAAAGNDVRESIRIIADLALSHAHTVAMRFASWQAVTLLALRRDELVAKDGRRSVAFE